MNPEGHDLGSGCQDVGPGGKDLGRKGQNQAAAQKGGLKRRRDINHVLPFCERTEFKQPRLLKEPVF